MAATISKALLSGFNNPGAVAGTTSGTANTIHTATGGSTVLHEVWVYAANIDTASVDLTVMQGGGTVNIVSVPAKQGLLLVLPGLVMQNAQLLQAYASVASKIVIHGFVNTITQ